MTLQGANNNSDNDHCVFQIREATEGFQIKKFWDLESLGIISSVTNSEKFIIDETINKIDFKNNRYEVSLYRRHNNVKNYYKQLNYK